MTQFQRKRIKEEIEKQNAAVDMGADKFLDKLRASKWTGAILLAVAAVMVIVVLWGLF